jgi:ABC-type amino acid transport substrate-binding protein
MQKILISFIACFLLFGCEEKRTNHLLVATSADYPPFEFFKNGEIVGFEIDLINAIAKEISHTITIKDMSFDTIIGALQNQRIDLAISNITASPERQEKVDFTIPYHRTLSVMIVSSQSPIAKPTDLKGKNLGVQMGSVYEKMVKDEWQPVISNLTLRSLSKVPDLIQDFKAGRLDAIVLGITEGKSIVASHSEFKLVLLPETEAITAIALPKNSALTDKINDIIKKFEADGTLSKLRIKWMESEQ